MRKSSFKILFKFIIRKYKIYVWKTYVDKPTPHNMFSYLHSKNTRVSVTRKRVEWGHTPFGVKSDPEFGQLSADLTNNGVRLTQLWVINLLFRVKFTDFRVTRTGVWPQWTLFRVTLTRFFFLGVKSEHSVHVRQVYGNPKLTVY